MSFGVAAHMAEQIRKLMQPRHTRLILDASRVAAWDATALVRVRALARDLTQESLQTAMCSLDTKVGAELGAGIRIFADLDRALEWAEDQILAERELIEHEEVGVVDLLGEMGEGISTEGRRDLQTRLTEESVSSEAPIFVAGERSSDILIVRAGRVTLCTAWPAANGLRLATVGPGMAFGEMAFLNGQSRSAFAGAEGSGVVVVRLQRAVFDAWAKAWPADALVVMANLAYIGTRRLSATTRQLRAVLE